MQHSDDERIHELLPYLKNGDLDDSIRLYTSYGWDAERMVNAFLSQDDDADDDILVLDGAEEPKQPEKQSRRRQTKSAQKATSKPSKNSPKESKEKHFRWNPSNQEAFIQGGSEPNKDSMSLRVTDCTCIFDKYIRTRF